MEEENSTMPPDEMISEEYKGQKRSGRNLFGLANNNMSEASKKFDEGNKGYLDEAEKRLRKYDANNDGKLDLTEMKAVMSALLKREKKEGQWRSYIKLAGFLLVFSFIGNFGMIRIA